MKILKNERDWQRDNQRKKKKKRERRPITTICIIPKIVVKYHILERNHSFTKLDIFDNFPKSFWHELLVLVVRSKSQTGHH